MTQDNRVRVTLALDTDTYKRLRLLGVAIDKTHQDMLSDALKEYLARWDAA